MKSPIVCDINVNIGAAPSSIVVTSLVKNGSSPSGLCSSLVCKFVVFSLPCSKLELFNSKPLISWSISPVLSPAFLRIVLCTLPISFSSFPAWFRRFFPVY